MSSMKHGTSLLRDAHASAGVELGVQANPRPAKSQDCFLRRNSAAPRHGSFVQRVSTKGRPSSRSHLLSWAYHSASFSGSIFPQVVSSADNAGPLSPLTRSPATPTRKWKGCRNRDCDRDCDRNCNRNRDRTHTHACDAAGEERAQDSTCVVEHTTSELAGAQPRSDGPSVATAWQL